MPEGCGSNQKECIGIKRAEEVSADVRALEKSLSEFQRTVTDTNARFGGRIGKLEAHNDVQDEQLRQIREVQAEIKRDIAEARSEQKNSIAELRAEQKESMNDLRRGNREILDALSPMQQRVTALEHMAEDVEKLKRKPGETWEHIKKQGIGWIVVLMLAIVAVALGLGRYI